MAKKKVVKAKKAGKGGAKKTGVCSCGSGMKAVDCCGC